MAVVVSIATFMEVLDTSIANVALPHIAGALSAGQDEATWVLTSYLVSNAIVLPLSGWLATAVGRKRFYMGCVAIFSVSSLLCGLAPSLGLLIAVRVLQGLGGGGLAPSEQAILNDAFPGRRRAQAFAIYGVAVVVAPAIGPTLGGFISDQYTWRWIFFINVPVGIVSLLLSARFLPSDPAEDRARRAPRGQGFRIDYLGFGLVALGLGSLQIVLDKGQREDWLQSSFIVGFAILAIAGIVAAVWRELTCPEPVVELGLLKDRTFATASAMLFMVGFFLYGSTVMLPLFVQTLLGYTATQAGLVLSPGALAVMVLMPAVGALIARVQARWLIAVGLVVSALSLFHMATFTDAIDYRTAMWARIYQSTGLAFLFLPVNTAAYAGLPPGKSNAASALLNLFRNLGGSFGIAAMTTLLARRAQVHQSTLVSHLTSYDWGFQDAMRRLVATLVAQGVPPDAARMQAQGRLYGAMARQATTLAFLDAFQMLAVAAAALLPLVFVMRANVPGRGDAAAH
jgi:MFS transporter, DHA2 family, multidrug resistance protein